ncbi:unnamed protein product [Brugia timori]|uniref:DUF5619 domain-containing protein n=1 Tax=Brugia timori TaxID=42155 RepID=A0A0R3Q2Y3_9BILA|nr:unnamed protein product [Brugia timori]
MEKTLLDEFAMFALQGILANPQRSGSPEEIATMAYRRAKAMMEARNKNDKEVGDDRWIKWEGGDRPVDCNVQVMFRDGYISDCYSADVVWNHSGSNGDIIKYRVVI